MPSSTAAPQRVRNRFREKAREFDDLYEDERPLTRLLRPGLFRRRQLALRGQTHELFSCVVVARRWRRTVSRPGKSSKQRALRGSRLSTG